MRRPIFTNDADRFVLRDLMDAIFVGHQARSLAWVFMTNHVHMVIRTGQSPLSTVMHRLLSAYALEFNRRHDGSGHVFQGRFGSRRIDGDFDLRQIVRYVLRNPVDAGMVADVEALERFQWCAYSGLLGLRAPFGFEDADSAREPFGSDVSLASTGLREWLAEAPPGAACATRFARLLNEVCCELGVSPRDVLGGGRAAAASRARESICRRGAGELGLSNAELARRLRITRSAVTQALRRC